MPTKEPFNNSDDSDTPSILSERVAHEEAFVVHPEMFDPPVITTEQVLTALTSPEITRKLESLGFKPTAAAAEIPELHRQQRVSEPDSFKKWQEGFAKYLQDHPLEDSDDV